MSDDNNKIIELDLNDILPNRFQPRIKFNEESIIELSDSIKEHGVLQPIIVRPIGDKYEIVTGERRYKASVLAGLKTIPTRILDVNDKDSAEIALIENVQRKDLTPIEEAISYKKILDMGYLTQEQLASKLGRSQSTIANKIRLLNLCDEVQEALMEEKISERHARSLLRLEKADMQRNMLKRIIKERLTVRKVDDEIKKMLEQKNLEQEKIEEKDDNSEIPNSKDSSKKENADDIVDITDLFINLEDDKTDNTQLLNETLKEESIEPKEDLKDEIEVKSEKLKEEKEEPDNIMNNMQDINSNSTNTFGKFFNSSPTNDENINNNESTFTFNNDNSNQNMMSNKMNDLLAPQANSSSMFQTPNSLNQTDVFSAPNEATPLNSISDQSVGVSQAPNSSMFSNLMNNNQSDDYIDDNTFKDFLNPAYVDGTKQNEDPTNKNVIDSAVFAKFLDPDYEGSSNKTDINNNGEFLNQPSSSVFNQFNNTPVISEPTNNLESMNMNSQNNSLIAEDTNSGLNSIDNLENITNQSQAFNGMLASEPKPDLLAPMGSNSNSNNDMNQSSDIFNQSISPSPTTNPFASQFFSPTSQQSLTPDNTIVAPSFDTNINSDSIIPEKTDILPNNSEQPIFITATNSDVEKVMPNNPIIDNPNMSKLLEVNNQETQQINNEPTLLSNNLISDDTLPTTIAETANISPAHQVVGSMENQPIIITDYNKQYDPVLPESMVPQAPQIDFKQIINMIRDLNDKIEAYGYEIDTEEYDLADIYQVIIKITKK